MLEVAVVLLGATVSFGTLLAVGPALLIGIVGVVLVAVFASYAIGRALELTPRMALLVACGNSICGNSAIVAIAPVIGAKADEVASSIAFTAVLGIVVVLGLPLLVPLLQLSEVQYGTLAGLTVYAVPQVLAATVPIGAVSNQVGTVVKLVRVLMLGPLVLALSLWLSFRWRKGQQDLGSIPGQESRASGPSIGNVLPWFIVGFLGAATLRSLGFVPIAASGPLIATANVLTVISMAGLGFGVDVRAVAGSSGRVAAAVTLSIILLGLISLALIYGMLMA
jgi:uncharacterized integral membrane protein (TIGR00698 family)